MRNSVCIICGKAQFSPLYAQEHWQIYKCNNCSLGVLDPQPSLEQLQNLYTKEYFESHYQENLLTGSAQLQQRLKQENHRLRFFRKFKKDGKILDIGCGRGYFLIACRDLGYTVEGIDISDAAAMHIRSEFKIPVHVGKLNTIKLAESSFDIITMWHSLEHTADPNFYIKIARRWLKNDGILVVDVPNYQGYDASRYKDKWSHWDLPFHFYHFSPGALNVLLQKHGFHVIREKTYLSEYVKEKLERKALPSLLARMIARCYSGGSYAVVAKKI
jgi:2-polyprenyl-3-methyl-5-hydroxy-6-metoxy-1,4-benzoquinol methylase